MINNISNELKKCGIYKINYSNGKIYIGQQLSIWKRAHEHNEKNKYPTHRVEYWLGRTRDAHTL